MSSSPSLQPVPSSQPGESQQKPLFGRGEVSQRSILWFAATTLLGAFLVFQVQPIISKCVLPWFGGTPAVWTTCMLFFQLLLFGGYLYAHILRTYCHPIAQVAIHLTLLCLGALSLPIEPSDVWKPTGSESPVLYLLWMLARHVGLPYFVLSSTGPLVQAWLSFQDNSQRVYRLYALSNAGSLFALLSYPFLFETVFSVSAQSVMWSLLFCAFVLVQGYVALGLLGVKSKRAKSQTTEGESQIAPSLLARVAWVAMPAIASSMLLVVTNHVCQDIAVVPFLWVLPLSLYLLSFIICFDSPQWYRPKLTAALTLLMVVLIQCRSIFPSDFSLLVEGSFYMFLLLGACLICHGEVARLKPGTNYLTAYYAMISAGGAIGGLIVTVFCPMTLDTHSELPFFQGVVAAMAFLLYFAYTNWRGKEIDWTSAIRMKYAALILFLAPISVTVLMPTEKLVASYRNFFGVLQVTEAPQGVCLFHGTTLHGMQRYAPNELEPTTYYGLESGVGDAIATLAEKKPSLRIGIVGLGCGVLSTYGRPSDRFDIIEINPTVIDIAENHFSFLDRCPSDVHLHLGDGRLVLERLEDLKLDLLVLDAFSSDAVPAHLLTREAMQLYRNRLADDGVIAVHISNRHLDLSGLVHRLADDAGLESRMTDRENVQAEGCFRSTWMILANHGNAVFSSEIMQESEPATAEILRTAPFWTDQRHNLVSVLNFK